MKGCAGFFISYKEISLLFYRTKQNKMSKLRVSDSFLIFPTPTGRQWLNCNEARK